VICPKCAEPMFGDQEWRLQPDLEPGKQETEYDDRDVAGHGYLHRECADAVASALPDEEVKLPA